MKGVCVLCVVVVVQEDGGVGGMYVSTPALLM